jgi:putative tryptophan/tyrosine transport system substrate-binding protein
MRRREFIGALGGAVMWPSLVFAQAPGKRPLICFLNSGAKEDSARYRSQFLDGMRNVGYVQGQNFDFVYRSADEDYAQLPSLADQLVRLMPNVIVAGDPSAALAVKKATSSIPIVAPILNDPIRLGLIASYARPGGNVTGILSQAEGLSAKLVEIALELSPHLATVGVLVNSANATSEAQQHDIESAGMAKGIKTVAVDAKSKADLEPAFKSLTEIGAQAVIGIRDFLIVSERRRIADLAIAAQMPTIFSIPEQVEAGGLISYGVDTLASQFHAAYFVDRILKGAKPSDLPVEFPTKLKMVINRKTAKTMGLVIPSALLATADEVIE